jgi:hypothetical protein
MLEAAGDPPRFLSRKLYQNCTKEMAFWSFLPFCKQLKTGKLLNLNCGKIVRLPPPPP